MDTHPNQSANPNQDANPDRGEATRQKLLRAAIDVFGRRGFDGATTRALTDAAGVNLQAIPYYFGGKQGLYIAAAEHIASRIGRQTEHARSRVRQRMEQASQDETIPADDARRLLTEMIQAMAELFISQESEPWARFLIREQMEPTEAFTRIYEGVMAPVLEAIRGLVGIILNENPDSEHVRLRTLSLLGGVMVFRVAHAAAMAQLDWKTINAREVDQIRSLAAELVASLGSPGAIQ